MWRPLIEVSRLSKVLRRISPKLVWCFAEWNGEYMAGRHTTQRSSRPMYRFVRIHRCGCQRRGAQPHWGQWAADRALDINRCHRYLDGPYPAEHRYVPAPWYSACLACRRVLSWHEESGTRLEDAPRN